MNLVESDILTSPVFSVLPKFQSVQYKGMLGEKIRHFTALRDKEEIAVFTLMFIRAEEKFFWESCLDLLNRAVQEATTLVEGVFSFDLLSFDVHRELKTFNDQELSRLMANHARRMAVGQERLIKYSSCFGLLKKLSHEDWGKIILKTTVEVFAKDPVVFDTFVLKTMKATAKQPGPRMIVIQDLSQDPVLQPANIEQKVRLDKVLGQEQSLFEILPEIFFCDKNQGGDRGADRSPVNF